MAGSGSDGWDPTSPHDWAARFGFIASDLFPRRSGQPSGGDAVLRDGRAFSFTLLQGRDDEADRSGLSWAWSANTHYLVRAEPDGAHVTVRRWDQPRWSELLDLRDVAERPQRLIALMRETGPPREETAIDHVMQIFRSLRPEAGDSENAIRLLHRLLMPTLGLEDALANSEVPDALILRLRERLTSGHPRLDLSLYPELLLRHAAAELFQEAHVEADRQVYFFGMSPPARIDKLPPEIRYTPAPLARILGEVAVRILRRRLPKGEEFPRPLRVFDPACGAGVFLTEMLGFAASEGNVKVHLAGFDTSRIAVELAKSCLQLAAPEAGDHAGGPADDVREGNALTDDWGQNDIVVMNPPFRAYPDLETDERTLITSILGSFIKGRPDKALAFLLKAWESLREGGVVAAVLPAALLGGEASRAVREHIQAEGTIHVIGRFENHTFFKHSLIESGIVVIEKRAPESAGAQTSEVTAVVAAINEEDQAVRTLRLLSRGNRAAATSDVFTVPSAVLDDASWYPRRLEEYHAWTVALQQGFVTVAKLFDVRQGMRTGLKQAFMLTQKEWSELPKQERERFFRPAAGQGTIRDGRLTDALYVFYPYGGKGPLIANEQELFKRVPRYAERWLVPVKERLMELKKLEPWYLPTRPRSWQFTEEVKLVSTYFGGRGSFTLDTVGRHVVVDGHAWLWKGLETADRCGDKENDEAQVSELQLLFAYVAILNSGPFHKLLTIKSRNLQGGQLRLEPRYLNDVPLPDLSQEEYEPQILPELANLGESILNVGLPAVYKSLDVTISQLYGMA